MARSAASRCGVAGDQPRRAEDHRAAVVHRMVEHRPGAHQAVQVRHRDADLMPVGGAQGAVGRRPVQVEGVADAPVPGRQHHGIAVHDHAEVADQAGVQDGVEVGSVGPAALAEPVQRGSLRRRQGRIGAHGAQRYLRPGPRMISRLGSAPPPCRPRRGRSTRRGLAPRRPAALLPGPFPTAREWPRGACPGWPAPRSAARCRSRRARRRSGRAPGRRRNNRPGPTAAGRAGREPVRERARAARLATAAEMPQESSQSRICCRPVMGREVNGSQAKATTQIWTQIRPSALTSAAVPSASGLVRSSGSGPPGQPSAARPAGSGSAARSRPAADSTPGGTPGRAGPGAAPPTWPKPSADRRRASARRRGARRPSAARLHRSPDAPGSRHPCITHCAPR